jgi:hypothetical protein
MSKNITIKTIILIEALGFLIVAAFLWLDELVDLPHAIFSTEPTPTNYAEVIMESVLVIVLGIIVAAISIMLMKHIMKLESLFSVCLVCEKVCMPGYERNSQESWKEMDLFIIDRAGSNVASDVCPQCKSKCESGEPVRR